MRKKYIFPIILFFLLIIPNGSASGSSILNLELRVGNNLSKDLFLANFGLDDFHVLQGPLDQARLTFQIPQDWEISDGSFLQLSIENNFSSFVPAQEEVANEAIVAGNISIFLDGNLLTRQILQENGIQDLQIPIPANIISALPGNFLHELIIRWDGSASCNLNLASVIVIQPESKIVLEYQIKPYFPNLIDFPYPFAGENSIAPIGNMIVLPSNYSEGQVASGIAFAVSLQRLSKQSPIISIVGENQLSIADRDNKNLIFVGPIEAFDFLSAQDFSNSALNSQSSEAVSDENVGIVEIIQSPWNSGRALMLLSGSNEESILGAATRLGNNEYILTNQDSVTISSGNINEYVLPRQIEISTFKELQIPDFVIEDMGKSTIEIPFFVSPDQKIGEGAFLELNVAHSKRLDYLRSGINVTLNGNPIGSVRLSDQASVKHVEIMLISSTFIKAGMNELAIDVEIFPRDICAIEKQGNIWLNVFSDSIINLPPSQISSILPEADIDFGNIPLQFVNENMTATTILISGSNPASLEAATSLIAGLANNYRTIPLLPKVAFIENIEQSSLEATDVIFIASLNDVFNFSGPNDVISLNLTSKDSGSIELSSGAILHFDRNSDFGYMELSNPDGNQQYWLSLIGSSSDAYQNLIDNLLLPKFAETQKGNNLLVIQGNNVFSDNISQLGQISSDQIDENIAVEQIESQQAAPAQNLWLYIALVLIVIVIGYFLVTEIRRQT